MRNLTVTRRKAFAGCLGKVKICIEDENGDIEIGGVKCRFLGKLKNKESATYEIGNGSYKLFAIYDKMSKGFCNDCYILPEGEEDITVTGAAHLDPFMGNPFLFDGNTSEEAFNYRQNNKKKGKLIMIPVLIVAVIAGFVAGYYLMQLF